MGTDARIAAVEGLKGAVNSAAALGNAKCAVASTCDVGRRYNTDPTPYIIVGTQIIDFHYGYPSAWDGYVRAGGVGIPGMLNLSGFTVKEYADSSLVRVFTKDGAPTPDNCSVTYSMQGSGGAPIMAPGESPVVTTTTTGC